MKRLRARGFTLIEVLVALFVLTAVLLGMSTMVLSVIRATGQSKELSTANTLLQQQMETLRNTGYDSLSSGSDSSTVGSIAYNRQWTITTSGNIRAITVTVGWTDRIPRNVSLTTYRAE